MTAETGMNDRQKFKNLKRLSGLYGTAVVLITDDNRSSEDVEVLLGAMQAFKENRLAAIVCSTKNPDPADMVRACEVEVRNVAFAPNDLKYLATRGVRFLGELYYLWFDTKSRSAKETRQRIMAVVEERFGLPDDLDPLALGWIPSYWSNPVFLAELNTLVLERCPTSPAPADWDKCFEENHGVVVSSRSRGVARQRHMDGLHFIGEIATLVRSPEHCPPGKRSTGSLQDVQNLLMFFKSSLWPSFLMPTNWSAPDWENDLWRVECLSIEAEIGKYEAAKDRYKARRDADAAAVLVARAAANEARRAEEKARRAAIPMADVFRRSIRNLVLSVRTLNCLENAGIETVYDLVLKTEAEILKIRNSGRNVLNEIKGLLEDMGLHLGMTADEIVGRVIATPAT